MRPGSPGFIGERLRQARLVRGLTMTDLAKTVDVSHTAVSKYESGTSTPAPEKLAAIAEHLGFPLDFFFKRAAPRAEAPIFYRSLSAATKAHRDRAEQRLGWMVELTRDLEEFVSLPSPNLPEFDVPEDPAALPMERIEEIAGELRWHWRLGEGVISDVTLLMENNGVVVGRMELGAATLDAFSHWDWVDGRPYVILNADKTSAARSRFDAAHELGHLVLHRRVREPVVRRSEQFKLLEAQAHRFAGAFLLPPRSFGASVPFPSLDSFRDLKPQWKVSIALMIRRCRDLGITTRSQAEVMAEQYGRRRWRTREPFDDQLPPEQPRLLRRALEMVVSHGVVTRQQIVDRCALPASEIEPIAGLPLGFLDGDVAMVRLRSDAPRALASVRAPAKPPQQETRVIPLRGRS